jgi:hypothetical protein
LLQAWKPRKAFRAVIGRSVLTYIALNNNSVADSLVVATEKELRDYYKNNQDITNRKNHAELNMLHFP